MDGNCRYNDDCAQLCTGGTSVPDPDTDPLGSDSLIVCSDPDPALLASGFRN
jgi:hypothetical protein